MARPAGKKIKNRARQRPISLQQAKMIADGQIWKREFNPDYDQVIKRASSAINGLRFGSPIIVGP